MTRKLAQYIGPTAQVDAEATAALVNEAYGCPFPVVDRNGNPVAGHPGVNMVAPECSADGSVWAVWVPEDEEDGIPFRKPTSSQSDSNYGLLSKASIRARCLKDWDPNDTALVDEIVSAIADENKAHAAYLAEMAQSGDRHLAAIAAREAVFGPLEAAAINSVVPRENDDV